MYHAWMMDGLTMGLLVIGLAWLRWSAERHTEIESTITIGLLHFSDDANHTTSGVEVITAEPYHCTTLRRCSRFA